MSVGEEWIRVILRARRAGEVADHFTTLSGWEDVFPGRSSQTSTPSIPRRRVPGFSNGCQHTGVKRKDLGGVGRGRHLRHSVRHSADANNQQISSAKAGTRQQQRIWFGRVRSGDGVGKAEKELARRGYQIRKRARQIQGQRTISPAQRIQVAEGQQFKRVSDPGGPVEKPKEGRRPSSGHVGHADVGEVREEASEQTFSESKQFKKFKPIWDQRRVNPASSQDKGSCSCHRGVSGSSQKDATEASPLHQAVHQGGGRRAWSGRGQSLHSSRLWQKDLVGKATITAENALSSIGDIDFAAAEEVREGWFADDAWAQSTSSDRTGPGGLEFELDADSSSQRLGSQTVGRICRRTGKRSLLPTFHGRAQQECGEGQERAVSRSAVSIRATPSAKAGKGRKRPKRKRKGKGSQGQKRRQGRELSHPQPVVKSSGAKPLEVNSVLEALKSGHGSFSRFLKILQTEPFVNGSGPRTSPDTKKEKSLLFPSLLAVPKQCYSKSSRGRSRARGREYTWEHVRVLWAFFTFLEGGSPFRYQDQVSLAQKAFANPWTAMHQEYAGCLHDQVLNFDRLRCSDTLGRGLEQLEKLVTTIKNSSYKPGPFDMNENISGAMDVRPDRMSLPEIAGIIDPADHLKGEHLSSFNNMLQEVPHDCPPQPPTKGCFKVRQDEVVEVYNRLLDSGVATLIPQELALRDSQGKIISGGLFAVPHKPHSDRIICDRRPLNELERRLVWAKLPHGALLTQIIVPKGYSVRGSGDDLSNYFYLLKHKEEWLPRNTIGKPVLGKWFTRYGCDPEKSYMLSFRVIPMGDTNAVDIAQQTHLEILRDCGTMTPQEVISYRCPLPASDCLEGLYIDDHITVQLVPNRRQRKMQPFKKFRDEEIVDASRKQYQELGIPVSEKKQFTKVYSFQAWGTHVDSQSGRVGTPLEKLKQLERLLVDVCQLPKVSQKLLQRTLGLVVHPCMHQRILMSLLQDAYPWVEKLGLKGPSRLPPSVREELLTLALALPLCHSNIKWQVSCRIGASDASLSGGGRAATLTSPPIAQTLYRFSVHKGEQVKLDWVHGALCPPSSMVHAPSELEDLMIEHTWNTTHKCKFAHRQHINLLEMKMVKAELCSLVQQSNLPARHVLLVDSRVCAGAWGKGRSSSRQLNRILRQMVGWTLAGRKSLHLIWVGTSMNPADHPSRGAKIPEPNPNAPTYHKIFGDSVPKLPKRVSNEKINDISSKILDGSKEPSEFPITYPNQTSDDHPALSSWKFREIFSGKGCLTQVFKDRGKFFVLRPVELFKHGKPDPSQDILNDNTFNKLIADAREPHQIWHFGMPCGSFSLLQNMNGGTRNKDEPEGNGTLLREKIGNELARRTCYLCMILLKQGNFFTIENPRTSLAWYLKELKQLGSEVGVSVVEFDQCEYGLKIPEADGKEGLAKKATKVMGNLPHLSLLSRTCGKNHHHVQVIGGVRTSSGWKRRSELAGAYPRALCAQYHRCCEKMFK